MERIDFIQSRNIYDYRPLTNSLVDDFGYGFLHTMMVWCDLIDDPFAEGQYWEVWLIRRTVRNEYTGRYFKEVIGICGLYTLEPHNRDEMWLGWFGVVPELRNQGIGVKALDFLKEKAKSEGCKKLRSYVDKEGKPLPFYKRNGFRVTGTVREFLKENSRKKIDGDNFEDMDDHIIEHDIRLS